MANVDSQQRQVVSAGSIEATFSGLARGLESLPISEVGAITMQRGAEDLIVSDAKGKLFRMQQPNKVSTVSTNIKIPLDADAVDKVLMWYALWNSGQATLAATDIVINVLGADGKKGFGYKLEDAVPTDVKIDGVKPGQSVGTIDIKLACNSCIPFPPPQGWDKK